MNQQRFIPYIADFQIKIDLKKMEVKFLLLSGIKLKQNSSSPTFHRSGTALRVTCINIQHSTEFLEVLESCDSHTWTLGSRSRTWDQEVRKAKAPTDHVLHSLSKQETESYVVLKRHCCRGLQQSNQGHHFMVFRKVQRTWHLLFIILSVVYQS